MWRALSLVCLAAILAACGSPKTDRERLAEKCFMDQMGTREDCACMAGEAEARLGEGLFADFVTLNTETTGDKAEAARMRFRSLDPEDQSKVAAFQKAAIEVCGLR